MEKPLHYLVMVSARYAGGYKATSGFGRILKNLNPGHPELHLNST